MLKIVATETLQRLTELAIEAAVEEGPIVGEIELGNATIDVLSLYYNARQTTIAGGSSEIQRNILAKNVLGLPGT